MSNGDDFACFEMSTDDAFPSVPVAEEGLLRKGTPQRWTPLMVQADKQVDAAFGAVKNQLQAAIVQHMTEAAINCQAQNTKTIRRIQVPPSACVYPVVTFQGWQCQHCNTAMRIEPWCPRKGLKWEWDPLFQ